MNPVEDQLSAGLHRLTDTLTPSADPTGDLRRGRRRRTRTRLAAGCGSAVVAASVAAVVAWPTGEEPAPVAADPLTTPTAAPATTATTATASAAPATSRCFDPDDRGPARKGQIIAAAPDLLDLYRAILVEHLDPAERHLGPGRTNNQVGGSGAEGCPSGQIRLTSYGTKLDWRVPGESGLGMIQVEVSDPWDEAQARLAHDVWKPRAVDLPGVRSAEVAEYDGGVAVVVHRTDGLSVALDANTLFGNNSLTPVSGVDLSVRELVAAAADPRFTLS